LETPRRRGGGIRGIRVGAILLPEIRFWTDRQKRCQMAKAKRLGDSVMRRSSYTWGGAVLLAMLAGPAALAVLNAALGRW